MSEFKGTPGPWFAGTQSAVSGWVEIRVPGYSRNSVACATPADAGDAEARRDAETLANAHLIAAAPELLEACQALMDATNEDGMTNSMLLGCAIEMAGNAIAKATGGTA